ncbi:MAG TPA: HAD family hydrolase [Stellaceae bacterium]|jgi:D-glycero-D-manno-heptose 1,7-bisphosphate phosphatase|nr:HAD family hydrolase [Stellaceae bacterium]
MATKAGDGRRGLILDRDGVVNVDTGYLHRIEECCFVDGIFAMAAAFAARGFAIAIATNQAGIGRGLYTEADFAELMRWMEDEFRRHGVTLGGIYHCPDHPTAGVGPYRRDNPWRKPGPGMMLQAAADLGLDLGRSWTVGDKASDIAAGRAAGIGTLVCYDAAAPAVARREDVWVVPRLGDIVALLEAEAG